MIGDQWRIIYINGERRNATKSLFPEHPDFDGRFFVDSASLPFRRCAQHQLSPGSTRAMEAGMRIKTSGNWYSLRPPVNEGQTCQTQINTQKAHDSGTSQWRKSMTASGVYSEVKKVIRRAKHYLIKTANTMRNTSD